MGHDCRNDAADGDGRDRQNNTADRADRDLDFDIQSCSATDCTGLIPSLPQDEAEIEHYDQIYPFLPEHQGGPKD